jgi:hypothetical protein
MRFADVEGDSHELQLHEQLPWLVTAHRCSSGGVGFDPHCVASFFISFRPSFAACSQHQSSSSAAFPCSPSPCRIRFFFKVDDEQMRDKEAGSLPALLSLEVITAAIEARHISVTCVLQIPCFVGAPLRSQHHDESAARVEQTTFIIRDVPTPMLLPVHLAPAPAPAPAPAQHLDAALIGSDGHCRSVVCKLRAAEVTGMGIPGKVWDAGLALAGASTASTVFIILASFLVVTFFPRGDSSALLQLHGC